MKRFPWYIPSWNGDLRLFPDTADTSKTILTIEDPTPDEESTLVKLGQVFLENGFVDEWTNKKAGFFAGGKKHVRRIDAPLEKVVPLVIASMRPGPATLSAIVFKNGQCLVTSGDVEELATLTEAVVGGKTAPKATPEKVTPEKVSEKAQEEKKPESKKSKALAKSDPKAGATVRRPTPSCPQCQPGAVAPASEVLLSFLNEEEHESWARGRFIIVEGGLSGHRYLLAHRHTALAQKIGRVCFDLDAQCVVHFHDWRVPPEEEILAAKLILKHREPWLRNEATMFQCNTDSIVYKNPFGGFGDGLEDADFTRRLASDVVKAASVAGLRETMKKIRELT